MALGKKREKILDDVADVLVRRAWTLATAESCTGGWVAKTCTDRAGSSAWFDRGFVCYSNASKSEMLGVDPALIEASGAVSEAVARAMAEGARQVAGVDVTLSVTGVAGPDGGTPDKPVGTVWFAWSCAGRATVTEQRRLEGDRESVRRQSVDIALQGLVQILRP